jgi:hypothetical protein
VQRTALAVLLSSIVAEIQASPEICVPERGWLEVGFKGRTKFGGDHAKSYTSISYARKSYLDHLVKCSWSRIGITVVTQDQECDMSK